MLQLSVKSNVAEIAGYLGRYQKQVPFAAAQALTQAAKAGAGKMSRDFAARFDRPTRYTLNSVFSKPANKRALTSVFGLKDTSQVQKSGGLTPADILGTYFTGGASPTMRYEKAFRNIGMLGMNEDIVPGEGLRELNAFGNVPASLIVKLISYFGAFGEQGYRANSTRDSRAKLARRTDKNTKGRKRTSYARINGVVYFYANGSGHLHRGIWAKTGTHGADTRPILMFVRRARYRKRFDLDTYAQQAVRDFDRHFLQSLESAIRTVK